MAAKHGLQAYQVVEAAATLADREGLERVTLAGVASALGVRSPSLYSHVDGLSGLRRALALEAAARLGSALAAAMRDREGLDALSALCHAYRGFASEHPGLYATLLTTPSQDDDEELFAAFAAPVPAIAAVLAGLGVTDRDLIPVVRTLRSALHGFVTLEASRGFGMPGDLDGSFAVLVDVVIAGVLSRT
jgi:AcrR family transcriptional regulator